MEDNLVNPQSINEVIQTFYGSYELFVTNMIQRRKELEIEKAGLMKRLKEIDKEESLIKNVLSGSRSLKTDLQPGSGQASSSTGISNRLNEINKEDELIKKVLSGFHGNKIGGKYFNAESFSLVSEKPQKLAGRNADSSSQDIAEYFLYKKDEINRSHGKQLISQEKLFSAPSFKSEDALSLNPLDSYRQEISARLKNDYLNEDFKPQQLNEALIREKFNKGISADDFVGELAKDLNLKAVNKKGITL